MPRPRKCRRVCCLPRNVGFTPLRELDGSETIILTVDEFETIRLIDREGLSQEQCGEKMSIARTTVQQIYTQARRKLADALVDGLPLRIEGGEYVLCDGAEDYCHCGGCRKHLLIRQLEGGLPMKIALPLDENKKDICPSFARAPYFMVSEGDKTEILENPAADAEGGAGLKAAQFVMDQVVSVVVTPRLGENAAEVFKASGMKIYKSSGNSAAENIEACTQGKLEELTHFHAGYHGIR